MILLKKFRFIVSILSSEWILTKLDIPNGGVVILVRTMLSSIIVFSLVLAINNFIDPSKTWQFSILELRAQITSMTAWYSILFGAMYTAFYTRFSSQWTYLANVYNNIKQSEASEGDEDIISGWKAGFIEDSENLHLACKSSFVSIVKVWGSDKKVINKYIENTPGGKVRFDILMNKIEFSANLVEEKYKE